jgi:hypothetical protein
MPDGSFLAGKVGEDPPQENAVWRGYFECAQRILTRYAEGDIGTQRLSYLMNAEGWCFRDRKKSPRPITEDDVRRVFDEPAKDRKAYEIQDPDSISFIEERAVFPIRLLRTVARTRKGRSIRPVDHGVNRETRIYPLANIVFCAHCEKLAEDNDDTRLRSRLGGAHNNGKPRYRHKPGVKCGTHNRSVRCHELEHDFARLITLLTIKPEAAGLMTELAIQSDQGFAEEHPNLYRDGVITREDYLADIERNEREIAHWEARMSETDG